MISISRSGPAPWLRPTLILSLIVVCALFTYWYQTQPKSVPVSGAVQPDANLTSFAGDVQLLRAGSADWVSVSREPSVGMGDTVRTGPSAYATVTYPDGSTTELQPETMVVIRKIDRLADGSYSISLHQEIGATWNRVQRLVDASSRFETTTAASVAFVRGTQYLVEVAITQTTELESAEGVVAVSAQQVTVEVPAGFRTTIELGKPPTEPRRVVPLTATPTEVPAPATTATATPTEVPAATATPTEAPTATARPAPVSTPSTPREARLFTLVNASRAQRGLEPLTWDPELTSAARAHTRDMLARGYFDYTNPSGKTIPDLLLEAEVAGFVAGGVWGGTLNVDTSVEAAHAGDLRSAPGRVSNGDVLLDPRYTRIGIGIEDRAPGYLIVTALYLPPS